MTTQSPLTAAKARFNIDEKDPAKARAAAKSKLVEAVQKLTDDGLWIDRVGDKGLAHVSNKKLLKLLDTLTAVKEFGGRDAVVKAIAEKEGRAKDKHYGAHFADWSTPRLWDYHQNAN